MEAAKPIRRSLRSIHALRGLAAGSVVIAHSLEHGHYGGAVALFTGRFGVEVFFVVSGIVIMLASGPSRFSPAQFLTRRFFRVVPLYWATTILVALLAVVLPSIFKSTVFTSSYFLNSMFFIPDTVPGRATDWRPLFKLGWTLNYEMFFYLAVAALFWVRSFSLRAGLLIGLMAALVAVSFLIPIQRSVLAFYANLNLMPFACGVAIAWALHTREGFMTAVARARWPLLAGAAATVLYALSFDWARFRMIDGHLAMTLAAVMVGLAALSLEPITRATGGLWNWLGDVSYSLYLLHMFIVGFVWALIGKADLADSAVAPVIAVATVAIASAIASTLSYRWFEKPINAVGQALGRRLGGQKPPAGRDA